jgi:DNA-binding CsgD family transcriptional regulator/tetratricopeptide (TPR) repeat protein
MRGLVCDHLSVSGRVSSPVFVGRAAEVAQLEMTLRQVVAGASATVVVSGEAGVGKTRLVTELINRAAGLGAVTLTGACLDVGDGVLPYAPLTEAFRRLATGLTEAELDWVLGEARGYLTRLVPEFGPPEQPGPVESPAGGGLGTPGQLFALMLGVVRRLVQRGPVLLVVEDLQWADRSTRDLLAFLLRGMRTAFMVVLTYRTDGLHRGHPLHEFLAELNRDAGGVRQVELAGLGHADMGRLLAGILGHPALASTVRDIMTRSDGNPFFAEELLVTYRDRADLSTALRELLLTRIHALSASTQRMLGFAAVAGRRVDHELLAEVTGLPLARLVALLREAMDNHVLVVEAGVSTDVYAFRHSLVQQAVYDDLLTAQRAPLHAEYARAMTRRLDANGGVATGNAVELGQLAYHWLAAGRLGEALLTYVHAGRSAEATIALAEAQQYFERAVDLWQRVPDAAERSPLDRGVLLERAANSAFLIGETDRAVALAGRALTEINPADRLRVGALLTRLARYHWSAADSTRAMSTIEQAVATVPAEPPTPERAQVLAGHARLLMMLGRHEHARQRSQEALAVARLAGARAAEATALNTLGAACAGLGHTEAGVTYLEQARTVAEEIGDADELCRAYNNQIGMLNDLGRSTEAVTVGLEGCRIARGFGLMRAHMLIGVAETLLWTGRWEEADELFDELFELEMAPSDRVGALLCRAEGFLWRGDLASARADLAQITSAAASTLDPRSAAVTHHVLAQAAVAEGRLADARQAVKDGLAALSGATDPALVAELCSVGLAAEAAIAEQARALRDVVQHEGAVRRATALLEMVNTVVGAVGIVRTPFMAAEITTAEAEWTRIAGLGDPGRWNDAVRAWEQLDAPYRAAYARWREAEALLAVGAPRSEAAAVASASWKAASDLGARRLTAELESLARRARILVQNVPTGSDDRSEHVPDAGQQLQLTKRERDVLALLADGRTNRQIAETLYISDKTASVHVSHILAKLGVINRGQAAAVAHRLGLTETPQLARERTSNGPADGLTHRSSAPPAPKS